MSIRLVTTSVAGALLLAGLVAAGCGNTTSREPRAPAHADTGAPRRVVVQGVDLTGIGYDRGSATAPVVVVDFSDFGCPYCGQFARETYPSIDKEFVQTGKVFFKYVPFVVGMFPNGKQAARAAECAGDQGRFWPMYERLYAAQPAWKGTIDARPLFARYAAAGNVTSSQFASCYARNDVHPRTARANAAAGRLDVRVTPTFFVNGHLVEGALPLPQFRQLLFIAARETTR